MYTHGSPGCFRSHVIGGEPIVINRDLGPRAHQSRLRPRDQNGAVHRSVYRPNPKDPKNIKSRSSRSRVINGVTNTTFLLYTYK